MCVRTAGFFFFFFFGINHPPLNFSLFPFYSPLCVQSIYGINRWMSLSIFTCSPRARKQSIKQPHMERRRKEKTHTHIYSGCCCVFVVAVFLLKQKSHFLHTPHCCFIHSCITSILHMHAWVSIVVMLAPFASCDKSAHLKYCSVQAATGGGRGGRKKRRRDKVGKTKNCPKKNKNNKNMNKKKFKRHNQNNK